MKKIKIGELELRKVELLGGMSYEEQLELVLPEGDYVAIVRWMETTAGKTAIPDYHKMSWTARTAALKEIVPWCVEYQQLKVATYRYNRKIGHKMQIVSNDTRFR